jgi:Indole-3-glycerol phosphate synthase
VLLECYSEEEWAGLDWSRVQIAGVNNRDLRTFDVDLHRGVSLLESAPDGVIRVSESGLRDAQDLWTLYRHGIEAALIGEQLVRQNDPGKALHALLKELESFMASGM